MSKRVKQKQIKIYDSRYSSLLKYPFKSKYKYIDQSIKKEPYVVDYKLKACRLMSRPDFSHEPHCWEMDIMYSTYFAYDKHDNDDHSMNARQTVFDDESYIQGSSNSTIYLVLINVNTRYLIVHPLISKSIKHILPVIDIIIHTYGFKFYTIKCDGEAAFVSNYMRAYCNNEAVSFNKKDKITYHAPYKIKMIIDNSPYTNAHKIVDAVIRTLRNAFGLNPMRLADVNLMKQMVDWYNNTPHRMLRFINPYYYESQEDNDHYLIYNEPKFIYYTPNEVQHNIDIEWMYIRQKKNELQIIKNKQLHKGLLTYTKGNIILIHIDPSKTNKKHDKQRRVFNDIAVFIKYDHGNVLCRLLNPYHSFTMNKRTNKYESSLNEQPIDIISVPIIYTKYLCQSINDINNDYKKYFSLLNTQSNE